MRGRLLIPVLIALACGLAPAAAQDAAERAYAEARDAARAGDLEGAVRDLRRAVELRPDWAEARIRLGMALGRLGDWAAAQTAYEALLEREPAHPRALHNLGNALYRRGRLEQASAAYGAALEADPDYLLAAFHHGWMLRQLGRSDEAERSFARCLALPATSDAERRTSLDCLFYLGTLQLRAGDHAEAARTMERVLEVVPEHAEARHYLGRAYRHLGRTEDARRELERHRTMLRARRGPPIARDDEP